VHEAHHSTALLALPVGQGVAPPGVGIVSAFELDAQRRAAQPEDRAKPIHQVALVTRRHLTGLIAVDHDDRRVATALVCISQLDPAPVHQRRRVLGDRQFENPGQFRCLEIDSRRRVGRVGGRDQVAYPAAVQRRDEAPIGEIEERKAALHFALDTIPLVGAQPVPFVDHHDQGAAAVDDVTGEVLGNLLDLLMEEGALDVSIVPALMKKGRPASIVKVIARREDMDRLARIVMKETGSLGIRIFPSLHRFVARREERIIGFEIDDRAFSVRVKVSLFGDELLQIKAEHDDCRRIASEVGLPLREVSRRVEERAWKEIG